MNMLHRMSLSGYKSIRHLEDLEFAQLNVLIGANGAGKSNLIAFFKMLNFSMTNSLKEYVARAGYANSILYRGSQVTKQITASLSFQRPQGHNIYELSLTHSDNSLIFTEEAVTWHKEGMQRPKRTSLGVGVDRTLLNDPKRLQDATVKEVRRLLVSARVYQFHDTSPTSPLRSKWNINDNRYLFDHGGNLAPMLYYLREKRPETYDVIVNTIRLAAPTFEDFALEPDRLNPDVIDLRWREKESSYELGPHQISDGTLRFMALVTLLCLPPNELPGLMIIDEPELGLHPAAIGVLGELIKAASASVQVFVSTQSVTLVNQMDLGDVMVAEREDGQSVFRRLSADELEPWLEDYSIGELWEKNLLGGRPR
ncbi:AAA family ATPase [Haloferula sargassicola]|uniref:ATPase AAA-type core domain-containing protein n=1 Tax=Haloferula sargassicola TaxID=490096 RepID=A0ABP9UUN6_9BACT